MICVQSHLHCDMVIVSYHFTFVVLFLSLVLLPLWFVLVGRFFTRGGELWQVRSAAGEKQEMT